MAYGREPRLEPDRLGSDGSRAVCHGCDVGQAFKLFLCQNFLIGKMGIIIVLTSSGGFGD